MWQVLGYRLVSRKISSGSRHLGTSMPPPFFCMSAVTLESIFSSGATTRWQSLLRTLANPHWTCKVDALSHWDLGIDLLPQHNLAMANKNEDDFIWTNVEGGVGWGFTMPLYGQTQWTFCTYFPHLKTHPLKIQKSILFNLFQISSSTQIADIFGWIL